MKADRSAPDATLATLAPGLADPLPFVLRIFGSMEKCHQVRVGIRCDPSRPHYMIEELSGDPGDHADRGDRGQPVRMTAFNGRTHRPLSYERWENSGNWSSACMTWHDVHGLVAHLQGRPRRDRD